MDVAAPKRGAARRRVEFSSGTPSPAEPSSPEAGSAIPAQFRRLYAARTIAHADVRDRVTAFSRPTISITVGSTSALAYSIDSATSSELLILGQPFSESGAPPDRGVSDPGAANTINVYDLLMARIIPPTAGPVPLAPRRFRLVSYLHGGTGWDVSGGSGIRANLTAYVVHAYMAAEAAASPHVEYVPMAASSQEQVALLKIDQLIDNASEIIAAGTGYHGLVVASRTQGAVQSLVAQAQAYLIQVVNESWQYLQPFESSPSPSKWVMALSKLGHAALSSESQWQELMTAAVETWLVGPPTVVFTRTETVSVSDFKLRLLQVRERLRDVYAAAEAIVLFQKMLTVHDGDIVGISPDTAILCGHRAAALLATALQNAQTADDRCLHARVVAMQSSATEAQRRDAVTVRHTAADGMFLYSSFMGMYAMTRSAPLTQDTLDIMTLFQQPDYTIVALPDSDAYTRLSREMLSTIVPLASSISLADGYQLYIFGKTLFLHSPLSMRIAVIDDWELAPAVVSAPSTRQFILRKAGDDAKARQQNSPAILDTFFGLEAILHNRRPE
jgi:hypothetical protein